LVEIKRFTFMKKMSTPHSFSITLLVLTSVLLITACANHKGSSGYLNKAPVEDRGSTIGPLASAKSANAAKPPLGIENAGKPGYYSVKPGDTLIRIGLDNGQNWRDIARWNQLDRPSEIEVGQVLRVVPPVSAAAAVPVAVATPVPTASVSLPSPVKLSADELHWMWPTVAGAVVAGFDDTKNKGLDIGGKAGDSVLAAMDGRVVYAGSSLRGYGNLVILKHNDTFLSAYAHNQTLLVKEDQSVVKGQKIAEMGQSDSDRVKLHFEIRKQGKPVDPAQYLPKR
jgi:lipoprotein NlpD